jgi:hypothetical protein
VSVGASEPLLRTELAGAQVRLTRPTFHWAVDHGLIDPLVVGRVFRAEGDRTSARVLGDALLGAVRKLAPANLDDYLAVFAEE